MRLIVLAEYSGPTSKCKFSALGTYSQSENFEEMKKLITELLINWYDKLLVLPKPTEKLAFSES